MPRNSASTTHDDQVAILLEGLGITIDDFDTTAETGSATDRRAWLMAEAARYQETLEGS